jgi:GINS complex subunit 3
MHIAVKIRASMPPSDYTDFTIPTPFNTRVRNALNAEPRSVRLSALVGGGGQWYGFGKMIAQLWVMQPSDGAGPRLD